MKQKTSSEIAAEITALEACKKYVPTHSAFGDNNHALLDAQIQALENGWGEDEMRENIRDESEDERIISAALFAIEWRDGHNVETPSSQWNPF